MNAPAAASLYERLRGKAAVDAAVEKFYEKVLNDQRIRHFFDAVAENLVATLKDLKVPQNLIGEVVKIVSATHDDVLDL